MNEFQKAVFPIALSVLFIPVVLGAGPESETAAGSAAIESRIERIMNGLGPPLQLDGEAVARRTVDEAMEAAGIPGLALAIVDGCEVVWSGGRGRTGENGAAVDGRTPFQVGSVSKLATAVVAMSMVSDGALSLDDPVNELLQSWELSGNEGNNPRAVRVEHLLTHSGGLSRTAYWFDRSEPLPPLPSILSGTSRNPRIMVEEEPGLRSASSNSGFLVLQTILEDLSGKPLSALAEERLFARLGMTSSAFEPVDAAFLARGATNHGRDGQAMDGKAPLIPGAPGGLWSSAEDLARFMAELMKSWHGRSESLFSGEHGRRMMTPHLGEMALGMHTRGEGERFSVQQAGGGVGSQARVIGYPDRCQGAAIVVNTDRGRRVLAETLAAVGREYDWPDLPLQVATSKVPADELAPLVGRFEYDAAPGSTVSVTVDGGELFLQFGERSPFAPVPVSGSLFVWPGSSLEIVFDSPVNGVVPGVTIGTAGLNGSHLSRIGSAAPSG